jgi:pyroglutamyl-peptidase
MAASLLLTGFEPFLGETLNPSKEIVVSLPKSPQFDTLILPVSYDRSWKILQSQIENHNYEFILMLGQAGGRAQIDLEKVALNLQDTVSADEDGDQRLDQKISEFGPDAMISSLPLREWIDILKSKERPVGISWSAGAFVCNSLYYQVAELLQNENRGAQCLFVHLPYLPEQVAEKDQNTPSQPLDVMKAAVQNLIELCLL